ncbi:MAG: cytochrome ubiquinol oxidase subunit I [Deferrisomatales bacterium]|nr:cytochrome ubiquinol oxidase subunit I [Deferrisomatales bacterium]
MDLPVIDPPIFPRWIWMEEIVYSHIMIATLITAFMVVAPVYEYVGYRRKDPRFDRLARSLIWFSLILFSPGAALGTGIPMWIMGTYPEFWSRWANLFFWPLIAQFFFFLGEVIFLFFFYYLAWDYLRDRKRLHIFFGCVAAAFGLAVQFVWDGVGGYMLTPTVDLPRVNEPVAWSAQAFFNPSLPFLFTHRFFGNISYAMLLVGGVFALKYVRAADPGEKAYFGFVSNLTFAVGFAAFFAMPFIGWGYAQVVRDHAPVAFRAIMGGHVSVHFGVKMGFVAFMAAVAAAYLCARYRSRAVRGAVTAGLAGLYPLFLWHPPLSWFPGGKAAWLPWVTALLGGFLLFLWLGTGRWDTGRKGWSWALLAAGIAAFSAVLIGGFVRERSKSPDTVYRQIEKPEATDFERGRFLLHERCLVCHATPAELAHPRAASWEERLAVERARPGAELTDREVELLLRYFERARP